MRSCITLAAISAAEINFPLCQFPHMAQFVKRNLTPTVFFLDCITNGIENGLLRIPSAGIATFIDFAAQAKPARFSGPERQLLTHFLLVSIQVAQEIERDPSEKYGHR